MVIISTKERQRRRDRLSFAQYTGIYRDEARHGKAFEGLLKRYFIHKSILLLYLFLLYQFFSQCSITNCHIFLPLHIMIATGFPKEKSGKLPPLSDIVYIHRSSQWSLYNAVCKSLRCDTAHTQTRKFRQFCILSYNYVCTPYKLSNFFPNSISLSVKVSFDHGNFRVFE